MTSICSFGSRLGLALSLLAFTSTLSAAPAGPKNDAEAEALLRSVGQAYKALPSYSDQGEFSIEVSIAGASQTQRSPLRLAFTRPNKLRLDAGLAKLVSDGKTVTSVVDPLKECITTEAPATPSFDRLFREGPVGSYVLGGPSGPPIRILLNLLLADDPIKAFASFSDSLSTGPDVDRDGKSFQVLAVKQGSTTSTVLIDPKTKLVQAIEVALDTKGLADTLPKALDVKIPIYRWSAGAISTEAPDDATFALKAPQGFTKVDTQVNTAAHAEAENRFKIQEFIGREAPAFTLTVLDGEGKTKTLSKADLAGKVVMIDFWATWCGPCLAELPQVQELIEGYAKAKKDVVIVALSQDDQPRELAEVRKLVERTLESRKIVLTGSRVGKIGLDPSGTVGEAFNVEGYPTVVVMDAKGVVRAAHVGFSPEIGRSLGKEIDALLEGKPTGK